MSMDRFVLDLHHLKYAVLTIKLIPKIEAELIKRCQTRIIVTGDHCMPTTSDKQRH